MTVAELITELQKLPPDKPIGIRDADTMWFGPIIHITDNKSAVELSMEWDETDEYIEFKKAGPL